MSKWLVYKLRVKNDELVASAANVRPSGYRSVTIDFKASTFDDPVLEKLVGELREYIEGRLPEVNWPEEGK